jgi:hypothetical protein
VVIEKKKSGKTIEGLPFDFTLRPELQAVKLFSQQKFSVTACKANFIEVLKPIGSPPLYVTGKI